MGQEGVLCRARGSLLRMRVAGSRAELRRVPASSNPSTCKALTQGCARGPRAAMGPPSSQDPSDRATGRGRRAHRPVDAGAGSLENGRKAKLSCHEAQTKGRRPSSRPVFRLRSRPRGRAQSQKPFRLRLPQRRYFKAFQPNYALFLCARQASAPCSRSPETPLTEHGTPGAKRAHAKSESPRQVTRARLGG